MVRWSLSGSTKHKNKEPTPLAKTKPQPSPQAVGPGKQNTVSLSKRVVVLDHRITGAMK